MKPDYKIEYGSDEWYLYHHIKNENPVIPLIVLTFFLAICNGGIWWIILIWWYYFSWCRKNNRILDNDPIVLERRKLKRQVRKELNIK